MANLPRQGIEPTTFFIPHPFSSLFAPLQVPFFLLSFPFLWVFFFVLSFTCPPRESPYLPRCFRWAKPALPRVRPAALSLFRTILQRLKDLSPPPLQNNPPSRKKLPNIFFIPFGLCSRLPFPCFRSLLHSVSVFPAALPPRSNSQF